MEISVSPWPGTEAGQEVTSVRLTCSNLAKVWAGVGGVWNSLSPALRSHRQPGRREPRAPTAPRVRGLGGSLNHQTTAGLRARLRKMGMRQARFAGFSGGW